MLLIEKVAFIPEFSTRGCLGSAEALAETLFLPLPSPSRHCWGLCCCFQCTSYLCTLKPQETGAAQSSCQTRDNAHCQHRLSEAEIRFSLPHNFPISILPSLPYAWGLSFKTMSKCLQSLSYDFLMRF